MYSLSTVWKTQVVATGFEVLKGVEDAGFGAVELDYRITESMFEEMRPALKRGEPRVTSLHNYCPAPEVIKDRGPSGDYFLLSSLDKEERDLGVKFTRRTIQTANDLEAAVVVLHLGKVDMQDEAERLRTYWEEDGLTSAEARTFLEDKLGEREAKKQKHLDAVLFALDALNKEAERQSVLLGLENRYHYHEIPGYDEFDLIFETFDGGALRYWHDIGHAHANACLGLCDHQAHLQTQAQRLVGLHIHDAQGLDDHLAPGEGEVDFDMVKEYVNRNALRVLELHATVTPEALAQGLALLISKGW